VQRPQERLGGKAVDADRGDASHRPDRCIVADQAG
jgi:hypothetical protein